MSITNVNSTPIPQAGVSSSSGRGFQRVGSTSGTSSFTPAQGTSSANSPSSTSTGTAQQGGQQPKAFKGRGQIVNIVV